MRNLSVFFYLFYKVPRKHCAYWSSGLRVCPVYPRAHTRTSRHLHRVVHDQNRDDGTKVWIMGGQGDQSLHIHGCSCYHYCVCLLCGLAGNFKNYFKYFYFNYRVSCLYCNNCYIIMLQLFIFQRCNFEIICLIATKGMGFSQKNICFNVYLDNDSFH